MAKEALGMVETKGLVATAVEAGKASNVFFGTIRVLKTKSGECYYPEKQEATPIFDREVFENETYSLERSFNNAHRWGINCEMQLLNFNGDVKITINEEGVDIDDVKALASKIYHYDDEDGTTSEIINVRGGDELDLLTLSVIEQAEKAGYIVTHNNGCGISQKNKKGEKVEIIQQKYPKNGPLIIEDHLKIFIHDNPFIVTELWQVPLLKF